MSSAPFAELAARSHFSFLEGSASPRDLVEVAARLEIGSLGLCDRNGLYGAVGFIEAARKAGIRPVVGVELDLVGAGRIRLLARGRSGYRQLCRAVSAAQLAGVKGQPRLRIAGLTDEEPVDGARGYEAGPAGEEGRGCAQSEGLPQAADAMLPRQAGRSPVRAIGRADRSEAPPPPLRQRRPLLPPPSRPQALRPTAGPFPEGWPSLPSTRDRVEGPPAVVDPADLDDCIALVGGPESAVVAALVAGDRRGAQRQAGRLRECFGRDRAALLLTNHLHPADRWLAAEVAELAERAGLPLVASATPLHATRDDKPLLDVLTAIRHRTTLDRAAAHGLLLPNCEHRLLPEAVLRRRLPGFPGAFDHAAQLAAGCSLDLDFTGVRFPGFPVPAGETPFSVLYGLCQDQVRRRYRPLTPEVARRLQMELDVIQRTNLAEFFLIVHEIMEWAREHGVPGQGRGSAADSIVAYLLGITRVDPIAHNLLFERFLHVDHQGTPDIDIDFSTDHREQVIQHVYEKYGADRTGMVANVVTFQPRLAVREVGKAMGFPEPIIDRLAKSVDGWREGGVEDALEAAGLQPHAASGALPWRQFLEILRAIEGAPRHLSIHVGGMLVTGEPLVDVVPVERATMEGRVVVQFDKDDVEDLGLIKMDLLGLRTLSAVAECLDLIERSHGIRPDLDALPLDDPRVYDMICAVDTIGLFQIESRAQQQALYQSQPREFNDLVVQVAIIRPGPIQGDAVNPYLRRRQGLEPVTYLHPSLEPILSETKGVILYQEQILRIVMDLAGYSAGEADRFRRAMNRHRSRLEMQSLHDGFVRRCAEHGGLGEDVAEKLFRSVAGFAEFGFCKSHAAAFARTVYETAWLRLEYPAHWLCALLNAQPMGFYHPSVLVDDGKRHGIRSLPVDVTRSRARCIVERVEGDVTPLSAGEARAARPAGSPAELGGGQGVALPSAARGAAAPPCGETGVPTPPAAWGVRLGFNYVARLGPAGRAACEAAVDAGAIGSVGEFWRHTGLSRPAMEQLVRCGAFDRVHPGRPRRELLWELAAAESSLPSRRRPRAAAPPSTSPGPPRGRGHVAAAPAGPAPPSGLLLELPAPAPDLPPMTERDRVAADYAVLGVSTGPHLVSLLRPALDALGCTPLAKVGELADGSRVTVAGLVIVRQAPVSAKGFRFFTLADEGAHLDLIFRPEVARRTRAVANAHPLLMVEGALEVSAGRRNLVVAAVTALDGEGRPLRASDPSADPPAWPPTSHDYH
ncbi:MAG: DNA polymerase III subunit alpha [Candidatus Dormibacteria bacterium]|jgi:error-prone DNA polymerase